MRKQTSQYERDFYAWAMTQADFLKTGKIEKVDLENIAEEIESLGRSEKKEIYSHLRNLIMHLLKMKYQPEKQTRSWIKTIINSQESVNDAVKFSPSLKNFIKDEFDNCYQDARKKAHKETGLPEKVFPKECPWTLREILK